MLIAVLSDLHIGTRNRLDRFSREVDAEARFLRLLQYLERNVDRTVLLGDVFETLRGPALGDGRDELSRALRAHPEIAARATGDSRYQWVHGNHDLIASRALGVPDVHLIEADGLRLAFLHGHQFDSIARGEAKFSRTSVWLGGWLERMGIRVTGFLDRASKPILDLAGKFEHAAVAFATEMKADVVVTGHTHRAARLELGNHLYMNSGTCVAGRRELLLLDTARRIFRVVREPDWIS